MQSRAGADAVVVGAGVIGCAISWRLAQAGLSVALLERGEPGGEASSAAAGILGAQMESHGPGPLLELAVASRALHPAMAAELREATGLDVRCRVEGLLELAFDEEEEERLRARFEWQGRAGLRAEWVGSQSFGSNLFGQQLFGSQRNGAPWRPPPGVVAALLFPDDGQVDNRRLAQALRGAAERAGVAIVRAEAREVVARSGRVAGVRLRSAETGAAASGGERLLEAQRVVIAAGSWSALLPGAAIAEGAVRPVRGQMIALGLPNPTSARVLSCSSGYAVPREDRVLVGATMEEVGFSKGVTDEGARSLLATAERLLPGSSAAPLLERWSGLRPASRDGLPLLGAPARGPSGLFVCTGHHRNGILLTPVSAELIRDALLERPVARDLAPFRPDRF